MPDYMGSGRRIGKEDIMEILKELCVPAHIKGYRYLLHAVEMCLADNNLIYSITKELYPALAEAFNDKAECVERVLRHAVLLSYKKCGADILEKYFGKPGKRVTNAEFIAVIVYRLQFTEQRVQKK